MTIGCLADVLSLGAKYIIGVDEVGRGSWAGPVSVCAAVAQANWSHPRVKDSKKMQKDEHIRVCNQVLVPPIIPFRTICNRSHTRIDEIGLQRAQDEAVLEAVRLAREHYPNALVVMDGSFLPRGLENAICFPKADALVGAVSAASVMAKRDRDELMREFHEEFPIYGFDTNAGYGAPKHIQALEEAGPCPIHRMSYRNIQAYAREGSPNAGRPATISGWRRPPNGMRG